MSNIAASVAAVSARGLLAAVPDVKAKDQLKDLLLKRMDGTPKEAAQALAAFIIEEGAAFCKLAQVSAEQPDVVDPVTRDALRAVQTSCKPAELSYIQNVINECIASGQLSCTGLSLEELEPRPLGVGSVAQVHGCGDNVIKISLTDNLETMEKQAVYLPKMGSWPILRNTPLANVGKFMQGAIRGWRLEFNMEDTEGRCLRAFTSLLRTGPEEVRGLRLPEFKAACSRVLVMSRERGRHYKDLTKEEQKKCLSTVVELASKSLFGIGMVHCDPHPGNILLNEQQEVVLLDFGAVLDFSPEQVEDCKIVFSRLPSYMKHGSFESDIADAMRNLGFTTKSNTDVGLAMLAWHTFDSSRPAPLEQMKRGDYGCKNDPPDQCFPSEITPFIRFRSVLSGLLGGISRSYQEVGVDGQHVFEEINLLTEFSKAAGPPPVVISCSESSQSFSSEIELLSPEVFGAVRGPQARTLLVSSDRGVLASGLARCRALPPLPLFLFFIVVLCIMAFALLARHR